MRHDQSLLANLHPQTATKDVRQNKGGQRNSPMLAKHT